MGRSISLKEQRRDLFVLLSQVGWAPRSSDGMASVWTAERRGRKQDWTEGEEVSAETGLDAASLWSSTSVLSFLIMGQSAP